MSTLFRSFLAGQLRCLPEILPLLAPTVNSYKRLVDGYWAPTKPLWGLDNVLVSPHSASTVAAENRLLTDLFTDNLRRWLDGRPLRNVFDRGAGY